MCDGGHSGPRASLRPVLDFEHFRGDQTYKVCADTTNGASHAAMITRAHLLCCLFHTDASAPSTAVLA
jgi:hypothetical protein